MTGRLQQDLSLKQGAYPASRRSSIFECRLSSLTSDPLHYLPTNSTNDMTELTCRQNYRHETNNLTTTTSPSPNACLKPPLAANVERRMRGAGGAIRLVRLFLTGSGIHIPCKLSIFFQASSLLVYVVRTCTDPSRFFRTFFCLTCLYNIRCRFIF